MNEIKKMISDIKNNKMNKLFFLIRCILKQQCRYCRHHMPFILECDINIGIWGDYAYCTCFKKRNKK